MRKVEDRLTERVDYEVNNKLGRVVQVNGNTGDILTSPNRHVFFKKNAIRVAITVIIDHLFII